MKFGRGKSDAAKTPTEAVELPDRSDPLILSVKYGDKLPARVLERGVNTLLVAITVPTKRLSPRDLEGLVLEYAGANGRVRLAGTVSVEDPKEPDVLRMDALRAVEVLQEREFVRIMAARPVRVFVGKELQPIESFTVDISGGGFLLAGPETLKIGERLQFHLAITNGEPPITGGAKVVRTDARGHRGVCFEEISDADRTRLVHFIFECQRAELRMGLKQGGGHGD
jgi:PilZ domain-containing protein